MTVLQLAEALYGATPSAHVLGISGFEFGEVQEGLSRSARHNLDLAEYFLLSWLEGNPAAQLRGNVSATTAR